MQGWPHEAIDTNVPSGIPIQWAIGYGVAVVTQIAVFPLFELEVSLSDNLAIGRPIHPGEYRQILHIQSIV